MRISSLYNSNAMISQLGINGTRVSKLMEQLSTLKRVNVPSDDPVAASRMVQLNREQSAIKQYQSNISSLSGSLAIQESQVTALNDQLDALSSKLLSANNSTHSQQDMSGYGAEISSMIDSMVEIMNAKNESGGYLFSGTKTDTRPVTLDENGNYVFNGNNKTRETDVANGVSISETTQISGSFSGSGNDLETLNKLKALSEKMQDPNANFADYQDEISDAIAQVQKSSDSVASLYTDLGGRQNRLELLKNAHEGVSMANDQVVRDLSDTDWATASSNLQMYTQSIQITNKAYSMVSQLNLFSLL
ncbi:flagellar hook-associated protein FlgL [Enterobacter sp. CC120223-11]|uniref:flagellar hook-associated protein FlgL n=1 Tax=Enterobacter sp. CC120223-11 TaxID=1378073 RepID=UPI000BD5EAC6|nr:flagellar hook-associated protein FlgL [Enterobacter sp. CC120223-11]SNY67992.1 flagellar hook-associated protein 3 FlgL [Enterobacter sp. CC120223-11]